MNKYYKSEKIGFFRSIHFFYSFLNDRYIKSPIKTNDISKQNAGTNKIGENFMNKYLHSIY